MASTLLYGLGAIGGFYAYVLNRGGARVSVVARSNYDTVKEKGLFIDSIKFGKDNIRPEQVLKSPQEAGSEFDYIVCTNKALDPSSLPQAIAPAVSRGKTTIVLIQNGVGSEKFISEAFPENTVISCVTWVGAVQNVPGTIIHNNNNSMTMGISWNNKIDKNLEKSRQDRLKEILLAGGTEVEVDDNIFVRRWEKVVWNAAWNSFTALTMVDTQAFLNSSTEALVVSKRLMKEIIAVAQADGIPVRDELVDELIEKTLKSKGLKSSMMADLANNRPMEVEGILGNPMRLARSLGVETPTLDTVYIIVKAQDWRVRNSSKA